MELRAWGQDIGHRGVAHVRGHGSKLRGVAIYDWRRTGNNPRPRSTDRGVV